MKLKIVQAVQKFLVYLLLLHFDEARSVLAGAIGMLKCVVLT